MSDQEYVLLDEIGEGAFGKVYKSRKESTQEILAAKVRIGLLKSPGSPIKLIPIMIIPLVVYLKQRQIQMLKSA